MPTRDGSAGSTLGLQRFPYGRGVGRDGDGDGSVPDSRLRLLPIRSDSDASGCGPSGRPLLRPGDLCSLSVVKGAGVEGASCFIWPSDGNLSAVRPTRLSEGVEARDWDLLREASTEE